MRMHADREVIETLYRSDTPGAVRAAVKALLQNPYPAGVAKLEKYKNRYEFFESGFWVVYKVESTGGEFVITILRVEKN